jgi:hypothetical protein
MRQEHDNEHGMLAALSRGERRALSALLRKLLLSFETAAVGGV